MAFGMKDIKEKNKKEKEIKVKEKEKVRICCSVPNSFERRLIKASKKGTKTKVLEDKLIEFYDSETKEFKYESKIKEKDFKVDINFRLDSDMGKALKKLSKKYNKTTGELIVEMFNYNDDKKN